MATINDKVAEEIKDKLAKINLLEKRAKDLGITGIHTIGCGCLGTAHSLDADQKIADIEYCLGVIEKHQREEAEKQSGTYNTAANYNP